MMIPQVLVNGGRGPGDDKLVNLIHRILLNGAVDPQHLNELRHLAEMAQCIPRSLVVAAQEIDIEYIFPGPSAHRARLDLAQADIAQSKNAERFEQSSRRIRHLEGDRSLVDAPWNRKLSADADCASLPAARGFVPLHRKLANQEETREVILVVFDSGGKNLARIFSRCLFPRDTRSIRQLILDYVLHAACRVIKRNGLNLRMRAKKIAALIKSHRMRQHTPHRIQLHPRSGDHVMYDPQKEFRFAEHAAAHEKISMLGDCPGQSVFNGNNGGSGAAFHTIEDFRGSRAGNDAATRRHAPSRFVAERTALALDGNFHGSFPRQNIFSERDSANEFCRVMKRPGAIC